LADVAKKARLDRLYSSEEEEGALKPSPFKRPPSAVDETAARPDFSGGAEAEEKLSDSRNSATDEFELSFEINEAEFRYGSSRAGTGT